MAIFDKRINEGDEDDDALCKAYAELFEAAAVAVAAAAAEILNRAYKKVMPSEWANDQHHMLNEERIVFQAILKKHKVLFDSKLGRYPHKKFHLKLKKGAVPVHKKPYPVP